MFDSILRHEPLMRRVLRLLLVLHPDEEFRGRARSACGDDYEYVAADDWDALDEAIREAPPSAMALVDPYARQGNGNSNGASNGGGAAVPRLSPRLGELMEAYPSIPWIAAMPVRAEAHEHVRRLGEWGAVQVIALGHDDTVGALRQRLEAARGRPMRALLEQVLPAETSGRARVIIDAAADVVAVGEQGRDLANALGLSRRTLLRWSERAGIPPPRRLLAWMRILLACAMLDDPGRGVLSVARTAGYSSDSGLRRITQKFLRASPTELRESGAFRRAAAAFVAELGDYRLRVRVVTREG